MADRPWRCSNCGTINEPGADSCRNCGKWPSLFDLEDNVVEEEDFEPITEPESVAKYETQVPEAQPRTVEVETFDVPEPVSVPQAGETARTEPAPVEPKPDEDEGSSGPRWVRWLVPIVFVVYLAVSYFFQNR
jgi:hypothetical protein